MSEYYYITGKSPYQCGKAILEYSLDLLCAYSSFEEIEEMKEDITEEGFIRIFKVNGDDIIESVAFYGPGGEPVNDEELERLIDEIPVYDDYSDDIDIDFSDLDIEIKEPKSTHTIEIFYIYKNGIVYEFRSICMSLDAHVDFIRYGYSENKQIRLEVLDPSRCGREETDKYEKLSGKICGIVSDTVDWEDFLHTLEWGCDLIVVKHGLNKDNNVKISLEESEAPDEIPYIYSIGLEEFLGNAE